MNWIKCSNQMPELKKEVLVTDGKLISIACQWDVNEHARSRARSRPDKYPIKLEWVFIHVPFLNWIPTHWMEMPHLPKDDK